MMRVDRYKLIYIDPLKTGSQSMDKFWKLHGGQHLRYSNKLDKHRRHLSEARLQNYRLCASVRNPYTRAYSLWNMDSVKNLKRHNIRLANFTHYMEDVLDLCTKYPASDELDIYRYYSCSQYLSPFDIADNHIIRMEHMKEDVQSLGFASDKIVIRNKGKYKMTWEDAKHVDAIALINIWAGNDFKKYGYKQSTPFPD